jgi:hypothetical protein
MQQADFLQKSVPFFDHNLAVPFPSENDALKGKYGHF